MGRGLAKCGAVKMHDAREAFRRHYDPILNRRGLVWRSAQKAWVRKTPLGNQRIVVVGAAYPPLVSLGLVSSTRVSAVADVVSEVTGRDPQYRHLAPVCMTPLDFYVGRCNERIELREPGDVQFHQVEIAAVLERMCDDLDEDLDVARLFEKMLQMQVTLEGGGVCDYDSTAMPYRQLNLMAMAALFGWGNCDDVYAKAVRDFENYPAVSGSYVDELDRLLQRIA